MAINLWMLEPWIQHDSSLTDSANQTHNWVQSDLNSRNMLVGGGSGTYFQKSTQITQSSKASSDVRTAIFNKQGHIVRISHCLNAISYSDWACQSGIDDMFGSKLTEWNTGYTDHPITVTTAHMAYC